jgi:hypothetical protein
LFGTNAGTSLTTGSNNNFMGFSAGFPITTGGANNVIGYASMYAVGSSSASNNCIGENACRGGSGSPVYNNNIGIGNAALFQAKFATTGNIGIGTEALKYISSTNSGNYNIGIGYQSGQTIDSGDYNIMIGYQIEPSTGNASNELNIGDLLLGSLTGSKYLFLNGDLKFNDSSKTYFGDADDVSFNYDGVSFNITAEVGSPAMNINMGGGDLNLDNGNYSHNGVEGFTGSCINITYSGGIAVSCND